MARASEFNIFKAFSNGRIATCKFYIIKIFSYCAGSAKNKERIKVVFFYGLTFLISDLYDQNKRKFRQRLIHLMLMQKSY